MEKRKNPCSFNLCQELDWNEKMEKKEKKSASEQLSFEGIIQYALDKKLTLMELQKIKEYLWKEISLDVVEENFSLLFCNLEYVDSILSEEEYAKFLQSARIHFYMELMKNPSLVSAYYELFKIEVLEGEYDEAYRLLNKCQEKIPSKSSDFSLEYRLLNVMTGQNVSIPNRNKNYIQLSEVDYMPLLRNYRLAERALSKKDYQKVIRHLEVCAKLANIKGFKIDFQPVILLAKKAAEMQLNTIKTSVRIALETKRDNNILALRDGGIMSLTSLGSSEVGTRMVLAFQLLNLDKTDIESYFILIDAYIDLKAYTPIPELLEEISKLNPTKEQESMMENYQKLISEKQIEAKQAREISLFLSHIERLMSEGKYEEVISSCAKRYEECALPYFKVKIAVACYHLGFFKEAEENALAYLQEGYIATMEASTLLYKIYMRKKDVKSAIEISLSCYRKCRLKSRGFHLDEWALVQQSEYLSDKDILEQDREKIEHKIKFIESNGAC